MTYIEFSPSAARSRAAVKASEALQNRAGEPSKSQLWLEDILACIFLAVTIVTGFALAAAVAVSPTCQ